MVYAALVCRLFVAVANDFLKIVLDCLLAELKVFIDKHKGILLPVTLEFVLKPSTNAHQTVYVRKRETVEE